jgi:hypothetical protein
LSNRILKLFSVISITFIFSCSGNQKQKSTSNDTATSLKRDSSFPEAATKNNPSSGSKNWPDSLIATYIQSSNNQLVKLARDSKISEEWLFDQIVSKNDIRYFVFQIGHDESDSGGANKRFITDSWLYLDSVSKKIYEFDVATDSLREWNK